MAGRLFERYGLPVTLSGPVAAAARATGECPFIGKPCTKHSKGGVCSIVPAELGTPVIVCPKRIYERNHRFLREIAWDAFAKDQPDACHIGEDGLPLLHRGEHVVEAAQRSGLIEFGAFGSTLGSEIKLPPATTGGGSYSVDFVVVAVSPEGDILAFVPVEVQTIDTTNNYRSSVEAHDRDGSIVDSGVGLNWENVSKRILPQLITKGLMLQGERLCTRGIYFVTPQPVFDKIAVRLGGLNVQRSIPQQPGSITFVRYGYDASTGSSPLTLGRTGTLTISTSDMSLAFISPRNLPLAGSYESKIRTRLRLHAIAQD